MIVSRRDAVSGLLAVAASGAGAARPTSQARQTLRLGPPEPFAFDRLRARVALMARAQFQAPPAPPAEALAALDYDAIGQIIYRSDAALWPDKPGLTIEFFHLSRYAGSPVTIHVVDGGQARPMLYSEALFEGPTAPRPAAPNLGFAGFRVMNGDGAGDWIAYQGASYFRAATPFNQYGLSARGLAIDTAVPRPEEFPAFTHIWLELDDRGDLVVSALLDGPSVVGAYRIVHHKSERGLVQEVEAVIHARRSIERLGVAPLTSMFWYGPSDRTPSLDWRPQIHDSDGLAMWTGAGERLWRPLANPPRVITNSFADLNPRGFGLMQRDRVFGDYQDDGVFYDRRPSAWVEPIGAWGAGSVQLVEIPTSGETDDNIVAFWTPAAPFAWGDSLSLRYRLYWCDEEPAPVGVARVVATRVGRGGRPGRPPLPGVRKFVVDFEGGRLADLETHSPVQAVVSASSPASMASPTEAAIEPSVYRVVGTNRWRLTFDLRIGPETTTDLRGFLRLGADSLTETWAFQVFG